MDFNDFCVVILIALLMGLAFYGSQQVFMLSYVQPIERNFFDDEEK